MEHLVKFIADGLLFVIIAIAGSAGVYHVVRNHKIKQFAPLAVMAGLSSLYVAKVVSLIYQPSAARPYVEQGLQAGASFIDNPGFPSDHALFATVIVIMLYALTPYKKLAIGLFGLVIIMGIGRTLALVHTPVDVIGGMVIASLGALWYLKLKR